MKMNTNSPAKINLKRTFEMAESQTRWSGEFDADELPRPGGALMAALVQCAQQRNIKLDAMASELGVNYGYINQLRNGIRSVKCIGHDFTIACADFLGVPRMMILMLADIVTLEDLSECKEMLATEVYRAMDFICGDPDWGPMMTPCIRHSDELSLFGVVKLYEASTGKVLLNPGLTTESLVDELEKLRSLQAYRTLVVETYKAKSVKRPRLNH